MLKKVTYQSILLEMMVVNIGTTHRVSKKKTRTPVIFWHNFIKNALISTILGIQTRYLVLT